MKLNDLKNYLNKILVFYFPDTAGYWNSITRCSISEESSRLDNYYLDFSSKVDYPEKFSSEGIPLYSFRGQQHIEHPIVIAQYALGLYEILYKNNFKNEELKKKFLSTANWFEKNKISVTGGSGWHIHIVIPWAELNHPWISAMAQGEAMSVLTRAALLTKNHRFEHLAIEALAPFEVEVKDGGLINYFNSIPVYEEFPTPAKPCGVLNGIIFALFGIYDLILLNKSSKAQNIFDKGIDSLKKLLPYYDLKYWTRYFLFDYPKKYCSSFTYHYLVIEQLKALSIITGENCFLEYSERWNGYAKSFFKKNRALLQKLIYANKFIP